MVTEALGLSTYDISALVTLVNQERLGEAEHSARTLLKAYPGAGMLWKILSVAQLRQGKDALPALRKTAELMPLDAEAHRNLGAALHDQGQWALALENFRRALELAPNDADCLVEAADALRALGRAREAVPLYQQALQLNPAHAEAQNNLGNAFLQLAQLADAAACYQQALRLRPAEVSILCNLGHVLRELGQRREAVPLYSQALKLDPRRYDIHWNLGSVLFELRRFREAAACFTRAIELKPDYAPAHLSMGLAMRQQRRPAEAEACCQAALAIKPDYVEALSFLGELRADRGRFAEAEELFQRTIAINPAFSFAYFSIATHRRMSTADSAWLKGAEGLLARGPPLAHEISLRYGLGKYFDDVGEYARAFENYSQANELTKRYGSTYDRDKLTQRVDQIMHCFDAAFMRDPPNQGSSSELPVLIVGMPRSGTSLTEQILASHPAVFGAGEVPFWDGAFNVYQKAALSRPVDPTLLPGMAAAYLERFAAAGADALRVVDKMPGNFLYAGMIYSAFPRVRIIHMQRHPLDTCLSIYFQNFFGMGPYANDLGNLAHYYGQYVRVMDHWRAVLPATTLLEVPYEALIEDQEAWSRKMVEFIQLPWDPKCLDFHQTERAVITASKWQVRQKIHSGSAGRWRNYEQFVGPLRAALADALKP